MHVLKFLQFLLSKQPNFNISYNLCGSKRANVSVRLGSEEWGWGRKQRNWRIRMKRCESPLKNRKYGIYVKFRGSVRTEGNRGKTVPSRNSQSGWYNRRAGWYIRRFYNRKIRFRSKMANISGWMIYPVDDITGVYCITFQPILSSRQSYCMSSRSRVEMHGLSALPISEPHFLSFLCILRLPINFIQTFFYSIS